MKKNYITPSLEVISYEMESVMLEQSLTEGTINSKTLDSDTGEGWSNKKQSHPIWGE